MRDNHIVRYFSSLITVSNGKVIKVTKPALSGCRMARFLYKKLEDNAAEPGDRFKEELSKIIENKISRFGFCTKDRMVWQDESSIPYGASEIMAFGLRNKLIDGAVIVCDGVGTVITDIPQIVQGVGARMHTMLKTSFIPEVAVKLRRYGCGILEEKGSIDQRSGVIAAAEKGYKNIAVTVCAFGNDSFEKIRAAEKERGISATILAVCTTGVKNGRLAETEKYSDMVWACNSSEVRSRLDRKAIKTLSGVSPVYVLTEKGSRLVSRYMPGVFCIRREIERAGKT